MYFKKLELTGFKSFLGKSVLDFEPGIAVIVGPNGCGKSNISDAIRWVLGEQSAKQLRGGKMEDVIFNGADDKKPLSMAEASITLGEAETDLPLGYNEVTVTRRVYRSGEGEYLINKMPCRLRDVNDLFMGTGVGRQAYSIIEQGNIDQILSSKPDERRYVFEEAAGITKYKSRKKEALRKIEYTEENLIRLNDIIKEVKRQINSINRYAKKAMQYKSVFEELKELDTHYTLFNYTKLKGSADHIAGEISAIREKEQQLAEKIRNAESETDSARTELDTIESSISSFENDRLLTSEKINRLENETEYNRKRITDLKLLEENAEKEITAVRESIELLKSEKDKCEAEFLKIKDSNEELKTKINDKQQEINSLTATIRNKEAALTKNKEESFDVLSLETKSRNELSALQIEKKNLTLRRERLHVEKSGISEQLDKSENEHTSLLEAIQTEQNNLDNIQNEKNKNDSTSESFRTQLAILNDKISESKDTLSEKRADLKLLVELKERFEGYNPGVKSILETKKRGCANGIIGPIADFIEIVPGYEIPVQLALSSEVQNILTDDIDSIKEYVNFLRHDDSGRASFIPFLEFKYRLSGMNPRKELGRFSTNPAIKGFVADFIKCKPNYTDILEFLFRDTIVVSDFDSALNLTRNDDFSFNIVTLSGESIDSNRIIRGGSVPKEELGILRRDNDIESLKKLINNLENELAELNNKKDEFENSLDLLNLESKEISEKLSKLEVTVGTKKNEFDKVNFQTERLNDNHSVIIQEIKDISQEEQKITTEIDQLTLELDEKESRNVILKLDLEEIESTLTGIASTKDRHLEEITAMKIDQASSEEKEYNCEQETRRCSEDITVKEDLLTSRNEDLVGYRSKQSELAEQITLADNEFSTLAVQKTGIEKYIEESKDKKKDFLQKISLHEKDLKESRSALASHGENRLQYELKMSESKLQLGALVDYVRKDYQTSLDELSLETEENTDWNAVEQRVEELKSIVQKMGPVNLAAIEENEELEKRYEFLQKQHEDLVKAKETLIKVISKINTTTRKLFFETFSKIRENFQEMFVRLFGGGKADLILLDESDLLESGIEIVARPPGKKLQNISLLSGGEKALTAVSLLFAIFKVKPSPFCVLDEIDAPLDESNIGRFIDLLKEFAEKTQFIVITHNKKTISAADVMYGITMEQFGVSKVVSVRFSPKKDRPEKPAENLSQEQPATKRFSENELGFEDDLGAIDKDLQIEIKEPTHNLGDDPLN